MGAFSQAKLNRVQANGGISPSKVVWAAGLLTCTLQPLRGRKTVQEIQGLPKFCDHFAAPLIGLIVFVRRHLLMLGQKANGVPPS
jgi:hypothetical protein